MLTMDCSAVCMLQPNDMKKLIVKNIIKERGGRFSPGRLYGELKNEIAGGLRE
jgi:hypothetical protein